MHKHVAGLALIWGAIVAVAMTAGYVFSSQDVENSTNSYTVYYNAGTYNNNKNVVSTKYPTMTNQYYNKQINMYKYTAETKLY